MRTFFLLLVSSWLWGITGSVYGVPWWLSAAVVALLVYIGQRRQAVSVQLVVALSALWFLGMIYGISVTHPTLVACAPQAETTVQIKSILRINERTVSYIASTTDSCRILIQASRFPLYTVGTSIQIHDKPTLISNIKSEESYKAWLAKQGIYAVSEYADLTMQSEHSSLQGKIYTAIHQQIGYVFPEPESSFVAGMLLAEQGTIPDSLQNQFRATGTSHILAISGLNISLLTGMILGVLLLLPLTSLQRSLITIILVWIYMVFIGWPISAVRASFFWSLTLLALHTQRLISLATVLILTTLILISYNPALLEDIGFELSIAAVGGIGLMLFILRGLGEVLPSWARITLAITAGTIGATLTTWPIVMYHFGTLSLISLPANLLLEPVFPLMLFTGIVTIFVSFIFPPLAIFGAFIMHGLYTWMDSVTYFFSQIPGVYYQHLTISSRLIILYYFLLGAICFLILRWQKRSWRDIWA